MNCQCCQKTLKTKTGLAGHEKKCRVKDQKRIEELEAELKESRLNYEMANFMYNMVNRVVIDLGYDFQDTDELDSVVFLNRNSGEKEEYSIVKVGKKMYIGNKKDIKKSDV